MTITINQLTQKFDELELTDTDSFATHYEDVVLPYFERAFIGGAEKINGIWGGKPAKGAIALTALVLFENEDIHKQILSKIVDYCRDESSHSDNQTRHLAMQKGYNILVRGEGVEKGCYRLVDGNVSPRYNVVRRNTVLPTDTWEQIKEKYGHKCSQCFQQEGVISFLDGKEVRLQQGHKDPSKEPSATNIFPQCEYDNRYYSNHGKQPVFDERDKIVDFIII